MQMDDMANPGMLSVLEGRRLWDAPMGGNAKSCADCHGAPESLRGVAASYPAWDESSGSAVDLSGRVNLCRSRHQKAQTVATEAPEVLALSALVGFKSRGMPIAPDPDPRLDPWRARGEALYRQRIGQLNLSCANCHDDNAGRRLASAPIPQAHPTGYPIYRLEWQGMGSIQRRLRNCMTGVRSTPADYGSEEFIALEAYLMERAAGMEIETPAVRP
jgi:sulfur-oxidizing protein SoxA